MAFNVLSNDHARAWAYPGCHRSSLSQKLSKAPLTYIVRMIEIVKLAEFIKCKALDTENQAQYSPKAFSVGGGGEATLPLLRYLHGTIV